MLLLAVHNLREPASAKVPFSMVILLDSVSKKLHPESFRCRQILPTNGAKSVSLWEAPSRGDLSTWLNELLDDDSETEVFEIQEQFAVGINEVVATRVGEQLTATTRSTAAAASQKFDQLDERFKISQQASAVLKAARDSGQVAASRVTDAYMKLSSRAMENERVAVAASNTATVFKGLGDKISTSFGQTGLGKWMLPGQGSPSTTSQDSNAASMAPSSTSAAHISQSGVTRAAPPSYSATTGNGGAASDQANAKAAENPVSPQEQQPQQTKTAPPAAAPAAPANRDNIFSLGEDGDGDEGPVLIESSAPVKAGTGSKV